MKSLDDEIAAVSSNNPLFSDIDTNSVFQQKEILEALRYKSDTFDRKWLAKWTAWAVSIWLFLTLVIISLNSLLSLGLSDAVLITFLGTTTLNVLGLSFIVLRGHFGEHK
jgi:uncharacterized membrane protein YkgB